MLLLSLLLFWILQCPMGDLKGVRLYVVVLNLLYERCSSSSSAVVDQMFFGSVATMMTHVWEYFISTASQPKGACGDLQQDRDQFHGANEWAKRPTFVQVPSR